MFAVAFTPGLLVGTATGGALELTGSLKLIAVVGGFLAAVATIVGIIYGAKWKSAHAVEVALNNALSERVSLVVHERDEARVKVDEVAAVLLEARQTIARLEALPNLERVLELLHDTFTGLATRLDEQHRDHEKHAKERHRALLAAIDRPTS
jgi:hypothetical protein